MAKMKKRFITSSNVVSLYTAGFQDDGYIAHLFFLPRSLGDKTKLCWVYRRRLPFWQQIRKSFFDSSSKVIVDQLRADSISESPRIDFLWSDDGLSVAVHVDNQPWAFIHDNFNNGFSKSIRNNSSVGNRWDEELYRKTFL